MLLKRKPQFFNIHSKLSMESKEKKMGVENKYYNKLRDLSYLDNYNIKICSEIGRGGFGVVYKCKNRQETEKYALKILYSTAFPEMISSELAFLRIVSTNSSMPKLIKCFQHELQIHILMKYEKNDRFITFFDTLPIHEIKEYIKSLIKNLVVLQNFGIIHRDIKPGNFLYSRKKKTGVLIDFGLSEIELNFRKKIESFQRKELNPEDQSYRIIQCHIHDYEIILENERVLGRNKIGTESFMPLEALLRVERQGFEVDVWSVGVILFQFFTRKYNVFQNMIFMRSLSYKPKKYNQIVSFILEIALIFGTEKITIILDKYGYNAIFPDHFPVKKPGLHSFSMRNDEFDEELIGFLHRLLEINPIERINSIEALSFFA